MGWARPVVLSVALIVLLGVAAWVFSPPSRGRGYSQGARRGPSHERGWRWRARGRRPKEEPQLGRVLVEVAARLRAGAPVGQAWDRALAQEFAPDGPWPSGADAGPVEPAALEQSEGVPQALAALAQQLSSPVPGWRPGRRQRHALAHQVAGAVTACRVAHRVGAPMADLLQRCAQGLVEAGEADAARRVAMAGPRATARLLSWLPLAGLGLGWAWGAEPLGVLLSGGWGGLCLVAGAGLMVAGRAWVNRLVRNAEGAGQ